MNIMNQQLLTDLLCERLGELMFKYENEFDYFARRDIERQVDAIYNLLDIAVPERKSLWDQVRSQLPNPHKTKKDQTP